MELVNLKTEYLKNPSGINAIHPNLSWNVKCDDIKEKKSFEITYK